jgi:hypothetical protein
MRITAFGELFGVMEIEHCPEYHNGSNRGFSGAKYIFT